MNMIRLHEWRYNNGAYGITDIICNIDEISSVQEMDYRDYVSGSIIIMNTGKQFTVKEKVNEIYNMLAE